MVQIIMVVSLLNLGLVAMALWHSWNVERRATNVIDRLDAASRVVGGAVERMAGVVEEQLAAHAVQMKESADEVRSAARRVKKVLAEMDKAGWR